MKFSLLILTLIIAIPFILEAQEESKEEAKKENVVNTKEFQEAVTKGIEERMRKLGRTRMLDFSKELLEREKQLQLKALELEKLEKKIADNERDLTSRITAFREKQSNFIGCLDEKEEEKDKRVQHMVDVISGMRPQSAADVLSVQEADISVRILAKLDAVKVSKIFNKMEKEVSARLQKQYMNMKK